MQVVYCRKVKLYNQIVMSRNPFSDFRPELFDSFKEYNRNKFYADVVSGIIVGIVALPLAIAFAIASGVSPEAGLYTAIIAGFLISFLGGSNVQIGGPTGAFVVVISGVIAGHGVMGLAVATVLAGVLLVLMGVLRLGVVVKYMPYPIIVGFTSGIAVVIFSTQINDLFGLQIADVPASFFEKWQVYFQHLPFADPWTIAIALFCIATILLLPRLSKRIPATLVAIVLSALMAYLLKEYTGVSTIVTIGDRFSISASLPKIQSLPFGLDMIRQVFPAAFTIAVLGAVESLLSATVAEGVTGKKYKSNTELIAQGVANIVTPFWGGIPATGAIARTMTNINNGGRTPVAGIVHAVVLLFILLFLGNLTQYIPMASLAGILVVVAYNMSEWRNFIGVLKGSKSDAIVLFTTFFLTVVFDLTIAIEVGLVLAIFLFMKRVTSTTEVSLLTDRIDLSKETEVGHHNEVFDIPKGVEVYEISGPFFFGIANKFDERMRIVSQKPYVRIIRMRKVPFIDSTGIHNLMELCKKAQKENISIILSGVNAQVYQSIEKANIVSVVGQDNICSNITDALRQATHLLESESPKR